MKNEIERISGWLKNYIDKTRSNGYVIGLSGGVDSSAACGLAVKSIGKENVVGIIIPSTESYSDDVNDGIRVANHYGIKYYIHSIRNTFNAILSRNTIEIYEGYQEFDIINDVCKGNIQARLRMTVLRMYAEMMNYLVLGTTNKSEDLLGYFTKGGDGGSGVDVEPMADYYKSEVIKMAEYFDLPDDLVNRTPSAGLWYNQTDENELGFTYDEFEKYWESGKGDVEKIKKMKNWHKRTKHKRETPPKYNRINDDWFDMIDED